MQPKHTTIFLVIHHSQEVLACTASPAWLQLQHKMPKSREDSS